MEKARRMVEHPMHVWIMGWVSNVLIIVAIVTAATKTTIAGFTPVLWALGAIYCFLGGLCSIGVRMLAQREGQKKS